MRSSDVKAWRPGQLPRAASERNRGGGQGLFRRPRKTLASPRKMESSMRDLTALPHKLDAKTLTCHAVIETPKGRRAKFDYDRKSGLFKLKALLPDGMSFPLDFGFVPSTLCEDGDPLDIMVLVDEPNPQGALVEVRLIGVIEAEQIEDDKATRNDRLLAVLGVSQLYEKIGQISDLGSGFVDNLTQFWVQKDRLDGKRFSVLGVREPETAAKIVRQSAKAAKKA
jgi:inorganic pyrophosphatase